MGFFIGFLLLFFLNSRGEDSVTSGPCQRSRKPKPDTTPCEVKDLLTKRHLGEDDQDVDHSSESTAVKKKKSRSYTFSQFIDHDPRSISDRLSCGPDRLASIVTTMERMKNKPVILSILEKQLYGPAEVPISNSNQEPGCGKEDSKDPQLGILEQKGNSTVELAFSKKMNFTKYFSDYGKK